MSDDLEPRLRDAFHRGSLPPAPPSLADTLQRVPDAPVQRRRTRSGRSSLGLLAAAVLLVAAAGAVAISVGSSPRTGPAIPTPAPSVAVSTPGGPRLHAEFMAEPVNGVAPTATDMSKIVAILRARVATTGVVGATVQVDGTDRVIVDLPGVTDPDPVIRLIGQTGQIDFVPLGDRAAAKGDLIDLKVNKPLFGGDRIKSASQGVDSQGAAAIDLVLEPDAAAIFADYTSARIGTYFAIVLDGTTLVVPMIQSEIPGGQVQITFPTFGASGSGEVPAIVAIMQSGALPFPLRETASEVVGGASLSTPG